MTVRRPVEGEVHVHYGQIYVESDPETFGPDLTGSFAGQSAGLCGAAIPGALWLSTGLHTGSVGFTVEVHDTPPPLDAEWEDVVEVSFRPVSAHTTLTQWAGEACRDLGLEEIDYRVRYCAQGMDRADGQDTRLDGEPQLDRYLLQFWPAAPAPDRVLRRTSALAAYWHDFARRQPPAPTPAERAESERLARCAEEQAERERLLAHERAEWGGQLPSRALREVRGNVRGLLGVEPDLVHALDAAGPVTQRQVALLAARRACETAGLTELDWAAAALGALADGRPLPPPFDDRTRLWQTLASDPRLPDRTVGRAVPPERSAAGPPGTPDTPGGRAVPPDECAAGPSGTPRGRDGHAAPPAGSAVPRPVDLGGRLQQPLSKPGRAFGIVGPAAAVAAALPSPPGPAAPPSLPGPAAAHPAGAPRYALRVTLGAPDPSLRMSQPHMALPALTGAAETDPLQAALDAVFAAVATYGHDYPSLLDEVWAACRRGA
ncbi:hypothetical protein ABZT03_21285 [Streptomyces sp. NPDC005574]|uniref:hypothetical protein n=1 Tax=Streptomyces sp. NPDC005574 TaxID=3156891 RepID=UPI0033A914B6